MESITIDEIFNEFLNIQTDEETSIYRINNLIFSYNKKIFYNNFRTKKNIQSEIFLKDIIEEKINNEKLKEYELEILDEIPSNNNEIIIPELNFDIQNIKLNNIVGLLHQEVYTLTTNNNFINVCFGKMNRFSLDNQFKFTYKDIKKLKLTREEINNYIIHTQNENTVGIEKRPVEIYQKNADIKQKNIDIIKFIKKNAYILPLKNNKDTLELCLNGFISYDFNDTDVNVLIDGLKNCKKKYFVLIGSIISIGDKFIKIKGGHRVALFFDTIRKEIMLYDPGNIFADNIFYDIYGNTYKLFSIISKFINDIKKLDKILDGYKFILYSSSNLTNIQRYEWPEKIVHKIILANLISNYNGISSNEWGVGYCGAWILLTSFLLEINTSLSLHDVLKFYSVILSPKMGNKKFHFIKALIRSFAYHIEQTVAGNYKLTGIPLMLLNNINSITSSSFDVISLTTNNKETIVLNEYERANNKALYKIEHDKRGILQKIMHQSNYIYHIAERILKIHSYSLKKYQYNDKIYFINYEYQ